MGVMADSRAQDGAPSGASSGLEARERQRVVLAAEVFFDRIREHMIVRGGVREERHGRTELEVIGMTEDLLDRTSVDGVHQARTLPQPRAQDGMAQIGFG